MSELTYVSARHVQFVGPIMPGKVESRQIQFSDSAHTEAFRVSYDCGCTIVGAVTTHAPGTNNHCRKLRRKSGHGHKLTRICADHAAEHRSIIRPVAI